MNLSLEELSIITERYRASNVAAASSNSAQRCADSTTSSFDSNRETRMRRLALVLIPLLAIAPIACRSDQPSRSDIIARAVADPARPDAYKAADALRKPAETLDFSGVGPGMTVGEFYPAGGYFTRMLSDVVGPNGHIYAIENAGWNDSVNDDKRMLAEGKWKNVSLDVQPFGTVKFAEPLDLAWVTQNYHDLKIPKYGKVDTVAFDREVFAALKPGGTFFVIDHEGWPGMTDADIEKVHRIEKAQVIREVTSAGFKLAGEGTFLHRPTDDHHMSIFDPKVRGHTDQYALKFVKPAS
jgi:predicted methyltransferase